MTQAALREATATASASKSLKDGGPDRISQSEKDNERGGGSFAIWKSRLRPPDIRTARTPSSLRQPVHLIGIEQGSDWTAACAAQLLERPQGRVLCSSLKACQVGWLIPRRRAISVCGQESPEVQSTALPASALPSLRQREASWSIWNLAQETGWL